MSQKCPRCTKSVYANERVSALGKAFHKSCFKCMQCNGALQLGSECGGPDSLPYCKKCYGQKFGPKGFGHGSTEATNSQRRQPGAPAPNVAPSGPVVECMMDKEAAQYDSPPEPEPQPEPTPTPVAVTTPASPPSTPTPAATTGPKFCPECGSKTTGAKFCPECGAKLI
ncbi:hypothetical protein Pelo_3533 [Pelomyxa schiedti]|nr:hypothetical protein Pelo_3533 [Pelomyxa schiedti]